MSDLSYVLSPLLSASYAFCVWRRTLFDQCRQNRYRRCTLYLFVSNSSWISTSILNMPFNWASSSLTVMLFWYEYIKSSISLDFVRCLETSLARLFSRVATVFSSLLGQFRLSVRLDLLMSLIALWVLLSTDYCLSLFQIFWNSSNITNLQWIYHLKMSIFKPPWLTSCGMVTIISESQVFHGYPENMILTRCLLYHSPINDLIFLRWNLLSTRSTSLQLLLM